MAKPIVYNPPPPDAPDATEDARDELDHLLVALHERGVLRLLNGLLAAGPSVSAIALDGLNSPSGQRAVRNAVVLGEAATRIDPADLETLVQGVARGIETAGERLAQEPPSTISLAKALRDPDVRRGMNAMLGFLKALGQGQAGNHESEM
ncbi:MAG TPA: DUF1641 domain-containing protein [Thermomicrobiales bacterium]|jgi:uncharacterized protein YjgD (DUF1641 family)